ncbi:MAG: hypothetical protein R2764_25305 [Bacteroidales bacterium]
MKTNGNYTHLIESIHGTNGTDTIEIENPDLEFDIIGDNHIGTSADTPLRRRFYIKRSG